MDKLFLWFKARLWLMVTLLLALLPLLAVKYYFTNDGPCHSYNAHVMFDLWRGIGTDFYKQFYEVKKSVDSNMTDHVALGALQLLFEPYMAEKLVQMAYVLLFVFACYKLISLYNRQSGMLLLCMLPLVLPWSFSEGFYNYSFSLALMIYGMYLFCVYVKARTLGNFLKVTAVFIVLYYCHPVGLALALIAYGLVLLFGTYAKAASWQDARQLALMLLADLAAAIVPVVLFIWKLIYGPQQTEFKIEYRKTLWTHFFENEGMVALGDIERPYTQALAIIMLSVGAVLLLYRLWNREAKLYHFLLVMAVVGLVIFLTFPDAAMGGWMLKPRFRYVPYLFLTLWICIAGRGLLAPFIVLAYVLVYGNLLMVRMPIYARASHIFEAQEKAFDMIADNSVVLPVNLNRNSLDMDGKVVNSVCALHYHAFQYAGCKGQKIVCDNYEAIMDYFPLKWLPDKDPYWHMGPYGAVEFEPQNLDVVYYELRSGSRVDYVLYANDYNAKTKPRVKYQIDTLFDVAYQDKAAFITLYKRNSRASH